jgi:3-carboxy-cis,cis-muconate cycloisomerase
MRENLADYANWLSLVTGSLGKMGQDIALMAQQGIDEIALSGGGGSSAMPHKQNPVLAETLVTQARFNATQLPAMHHALVHEQERSGSAWPLELMVLPAMVTTTGTALTHAHNLISQITRVGAAD